MGLTYAARRRGDGWRWMTGMSSRIGPLCKVRLEKTYLPSNGTSLKRQILYPERPLSSQYFSTR